MNPHVSIIGLGYVGLPLAVEFGKYFRTTGFDINERRLTELRAGRDRTLEVGPTELKASAKLSFSSRIEDIKGCDFFILVLGLTFKENCPDIRNSKVIDVIRELQDFGCKVSVYDPWAEPAEVRHEYGLELSPRPNGDQKAAMDAVVLAVAHDRFRDLDMGRFSKDNVVIFDIKGFLANAAVDGRL